MRCHRKVLYCTQYASASVITCKHLRMPFLPLHYSEPYVRPTIIAQLNKLLLADAAPPTVAAEQRIRRALRLAHKLTILIPWRIRVYIAAAHEKELS